MTEAIPRDPAANLAFRKKVYAACASDKGMQAAFVDLCRRDILAYINLFVWQFNPMAKADDNLAKTGPMATYRRQDEMVLEIAAAIRNQGDLVIQKSRKEGASWLNLAAMDWFCRFFPDNKFLLVSKDEKSVDERGEPDSLMWKLDYIQGKLPGWMPGRDERGRKKLLIPYSTGSVITGAASTGKAGVSGRATAVFVDEFTLIEEDRQLLANTADTAACRIFNFTHYGTGTAAYSLTQRPDMNVFTIHWSQHALKARGLYRWNPHKHQPDILDPWTGPVEIWPARREKPAVVKHFPTEWDFVAEGPTGGPFPHLRSPWYDVECIRRANRRDIASHLDIDPSGSSVQVFDPFQTMIVKQECTRDPDWEGDTLIDKDLAQPLGLEPRRGGPLSLWFQPGPGGTVPPGTYVIGCDISTGTGASPSVACVANALTGEQVGEYVHHHLDAKQFAAKVCALARLFVGHKGETAKVSWEANGGAGKDFGQRVHDLGLRSVYYRPSDPFSRNPTPSDRWGWASTPETKMSLIEGLKTAVGERLFVPRSAKLCDECLEFRYVRNTVEHMKENNSDPSGSGTNHGDRPIAAGQCWLLMSALPHHGPGPRVGVQPNGTTIIPVGSLAWRQQLHAANERADGEQPLGRNWR